MRQVFWWYLLSGKRYMKQLLFLSVLLAFPAAVFFFGRIQKQAPAQIAIALWIQDQGGESLDGQLAAELEQYGKKQGTLFRFYRCPDLEQLKEDVAARRAECGYAIEKGLEEKLDSGRFSRAIEMYTAPSTVAGELAQETVFSVLSRIYNRKILTNYVEQGELFDSIQIPEERKRAVEQAGVLYDQFVKNGSTFHFQYTEDEKALAGPEPERNIEENVVPVRGIGAVLVLAAGLYGALRISQDENNGLFFSLSYAMSLPCRLACLAAPLSLAALSFLLALILSGTAGTMGTELPALVLYVLAVGGFSWLLKCVCPSSQVLCCIIPFWIAGSLIFCPVFADISRYLPLAGALGRIFLPGYYLRLF